MPPQYIFIMKDLRKVTPQGKEILKGIWLSFYPGAKIGVLGRERRGQVDAAAHHGRRRTRTSRARRSPADRHDASATCRRSRSSIPTKNVLAARRGGGRRQARDPQRASRSCRPTASDENADELGRLQDQIDAGQPVGARPPARDRDGRAAPAAARRRRHDALGRRAAPRRAVPDPADASPTCCCSTSRRTTSTPSRSRGSSGTCQEYPGTVVAITHDRYFLDNVAGWILELDRGAGIPWEGNYSSWLEQKKKRLQQEEKEESKPAAHARARAGVGPHVGPRAPGEGQGAHSRTTRSCWPRSRRPTSATAAPRS